MNLLLGALLDDRATVCGGVNRNNQTWEKCFAIQIKNNTNIYTAEMKERRAFASSLPTQNFLWVTGMTPFCGFYMRAILKYFYLFKIFSL